MASQVVMTNSSSVVNIIVDVLVLLNKAKHLGVEVCRLVSESLRYRDFPHREILEKILAELLAVQDSVGLTASELAHRINYSLSHVKRTLILLHSLGLVCRRGVRVRHGSYAYAYYIDRRQLAQALERLADMLDKVAQYLHEKAEKLRETARLLVSHP